MARPVMLTGLVLDLIVSAVREGCFLRVAAARAGKRESKNRAEHEALGKPLDTPLTRFEYVYLSLEGD